MRSPNQQNSIGSIAGKIAKVTILLSSMVAGAQRGTAQDVFATLNLGPTTARATDELQPNTWISNPNLQNVPSQAAINECIERAYASAVKIEFYDPNNLEMILATMCGYSIKLPENSQTQAANGKAYIVTCKHAEVVLGKSLTQMVIKVVTPGNERYSPVTMIDRPWGIDTVILEMNASDLSQCGKLPFETVCTTDQEEPLIVCQTPRLLDKVYFDQQLKKMVTDTEGAGRYILTHRLQGTAAVDHKYNRSRSFNMAGHLLPGSSGSGVVAFRNGKPTFIGTAVRYDVAEDDPNSLAALTGEINFDGVFVSTEHVAQLLKDAGRMKK